MTEFRNRHERRAFEAQLRKAQKQAMQRGAERAIHEMPTEILENPLPICIGVPVAGCPPTMPSKSSG